MTEDVEIAVRQRMFDGVFSFVLTRHFYRMMMYHPLLLQQEFPSFERLIELNRLAFLIAFASLVVYIDSKSMKGCYSLTKTHRRFCLYISVKRTFSLPMSSDESSATFIFKGRPIH